MSMKKEALVSWLIVAILLLAAVFRFFNIDFQSLWLDEIYTMRMADPRFDIGKIYEQSMKVDGLSVFYFIIVNTFFKLFGYSAVAARSVSAVFGVLGVYGIFLLGKELFDRRTGLIAAAILCVNQFHIYHSQDARSYTMFAAGVIFSFYFMLRLIRHATGKHAICYGLAVLFMLLSHFFGLFVLMAQLTMITSGLFLLKGPDRRRLFGYSLLSGSIAVIGFLPVLPILMKWAAVKSFWIPRPGNDAFADIYRQFFGNAYSLVYLTVLLIIYFLFTLFGAKETTQDGRYIALRRSFAVLACWILVTYFIPYLRSFLVVPMLLSRYLIAILPAIVLLVAAGISVISDRVIGNAVAALLVVVSVVELGLAANYYRSPSKSNFRDVSAFVVTHNSFRADIRTALKYHFDYYLDRLGNDVKVDDTPLDTLIGRERGGRAAARPFWVLVGHGLDMPLSDSNSLFLKTHYREAKSLYFADASARLYLPSEHNTDSRQQILQLCPEGAGSPAAEADIALFTNASVHSEKIFLLKGHHRLLVKALSAPARPVAGQHAHLVVAVNEQAAGDYYLRPYSYLDGDTVAFEVPADAAYEIQLRFDNDTAAGGGDRNVFIREVRILE